MSFIKRAVIIFILIEYIKCQSLNDLDAGKLKENIEKGIGNLDLDIPDVDLNSTNLPNAEDIEKAVREKCEKNGAKNAVDLLKSEQENAQACLESYVNITALQEELEEAKKTGSMDEVFAKYCKKWPDIKKCLDNSTAIARTCMDKREEEAFNRTLEISNDLQEFMCVKGGDRLAMFVAEGGVECVSERQDGIQDCLNKTISSRLPDTDEFSFTNLPILFLSNEDCDDFDALRVCVNVELEKCSQSTPANIVDAFFKFLKKQLPCKSTELGKAQKSTKPNSAWSVSSSSLVVFVSFLYLRFY